MPVYEIQAPNGKTYRIEGPEGATDAQVRQAVLKQHPDASQRVKPKPVKGWAESLKDSAVNTAAGLVQGVAAIPDAVTQASAGAMRYGAQGLGAGGGGVLRAMGLDDAAKGLEHYTGMADRAWAKPATLGGMVERAAPTPQDGVGKAVRFTSQMAGGALVPIGPKVTAPISVPRTSGRSTVAEMAMAPGTKAAGRQIVSDGERAGIRVMTTDVAPPKTFIGKGVQALGERVPFIGTGGQRAAQQVERTEAVRNLAREYGAASGDELAAPAIDDVMVDFAKTRGAAVAKHAADKAAVINGTAGEVPVPNTIAALDAEIAKFAKVDTPAAKALVGKLRSWKNALLVPGRTESTGLLDAAGNPITRTIAPNGKDLRTIDLIRAEMGEAFKDPSLASIKSAGEKALQSIYGPMKTDMGTFIRNVGGPDAMVRWSKANAALSGMADELRVTTLRGVLRSGKGTPEDVAKILFSNKPSLVRRLYGGLSTEGRARAQAAILQRMLEKSGGMEATSPAKFTTQIGAMGKSIGVFFSADDLAKIEGLSRVLKATARGGEAAVMTNSGQQAVPLGIGAVAASHPFLVGGGSLLARAYESATVRNALLGLGKVKAGTPAYAVRLERANGALSAAIANLEKSAVNDNMGVAVAAGDGQENQQEQQPAFQP